MDWLQIVAPALVSNVSLFIGWKLFKNRIYGQIAAFANQFIAELMQDAIENPEKLAPLIKTLTEQGMKSIGIQKDGTLPPLKIGGLRIPGWLIQGALPMAQEAMKKGGLVSGKEAVKSVFG